MPSITLLGLGPGDPDLLTRQAWQVLESCSEVYLRTRQHPAVAGLPEKVAIHSFDHLYEAGESFEAVYSQIVDQVLELGRRPQGVVYAVPGHPFVAEATGPEIARRARTEGLPVRVVEGLSFLEPLCTALGIDPFPNLALVDALDVVAAHVPSFPTSAPAIIAQVYSPMVAADVKLTLNALYPDEHPVRLVHAAGTAQQIIEDLALYEIDRSSHIGLLTALYVPPLGAATSFEAFQEVIAALRAPDGCPWDREQTHQSMRGSLLEETYEVLAALDADDAGKMCEELGDLLLHIVMQAQIASENGEFTMADVLQGIHTKIVRRHPHVFGDLEQQDVQGVLKTWERLKAEERAANGKAEASILDGVEQALPALVKAQLYQARAGHVGFEWPSIQQVLEKLDEELAEVKAAQDSEEQLYEMGDVLFAAVNLARWYKVDAESALREANMRFRRRFGYIEMSARQQGKAVSDFSIDEMLELWEQSKRIA
jgi:tetrapyrrole methylase family protein / MazG family protein